MNPHTRGYRRACQSLLAAGLLPAPCLPELQQLWAEGNAADRGLVQEIVTRWELAVD